jgi:hypothetical protein
LSQQAINVLVGGAAIHAVKSDIIPGSHPGHQLKAEPVKFEAE